jgi:hypothetical protein
MPKPLNQWNWIGLKQTVSSEPFFLRYRVEYFLYKLSYYFINGSDLIIIKVLNKEI